jgi:2-methylisocitrate lyase-like PEP mutase family enzyme
MDLARQRERAQALQRLHSGPGVLVLVNAWDAASARIFEKAGSPAIGTTSAGIAWSLGYADGEHVAVEDLVGACERICRVVDVPVSADVERGFGTGPEEVRATVRALMEVGVVGVNIEDGRLPGAGKLMPAAVLCEKIAALRSLARETGVDLFINARTDAYFVPWDDPRARYAEAVRRARAFVEAGASGIFAPGLESIDDMERMAREIDRPLNVYAGYEGIPPVEALRSAGVRRVSLGCGPFQALLALARRIATETLTEGTYSAMTADMIDNGDLNSLFSPTRGASA